MLTHFCTLKMAQLHGAHSINCDSGRNYATAGDDSLVQMNVPSLGGGDNDRIFSCWVVRATRQLDMRFEGFQT